MLICHVFVITGNDLWYLYIVIRQGQCEIPDDKTSSLSTRDIIKHSVSGDLICVVNKRDERRNMDAMPNLLIFV